MSCRAEKNDGGHSTLRSGAENRTVQETGREMHIGTVQETV